MKEAFLLFHCEMCLCFGLANIAVHFAENVVNVAVTIPSTMMLDDGFSASSSCVFLPFTSPTAAASTFLRTPRENKTSCLKKLFIYSSICCVGLVAAG